MRLGIWHLLLLVAAVTAAGEESQAGEAIQGKLASDKEAPIRFKVADIDQWAIDRSEAGTTPTKADMDRWVEQRSAAGTSPTEAAVTSKEATTTTSTTKATTTTATTSTTTEAASKTTPKTVPATSTTTTVAAATKSASTTVAAATKTTVVSAKTTAKNATMTAATDSSTVAATNTTATEATNSSIATTNGKVTTNSAKGKSGCQSPRPGDNCYKCKGVEGKICRPIPSTPYFNMSNVKGRVCDVNLETASAKEVEEVRAQLAAKVMTAIGDKYSLICFLPFHTGNGTEKEQEKEKEKEKEKKNEKEKEKEKEKEEKEKEKKDANETKVEKGEAEKSIVTEASVANSEPEEKKVTRSKAKTGDAKAGPLILSMYIVRKDKKDMTKQNSAEVTKLLAEKAGITGDVAFEKIRYYKCSGAETAAVVWALGLLLPLLVALR